MKRNTTFLTDDQINQLAVYAPLATVNRIDEYEVVAKIAPTLPDRVERVLTCPNSNCISRSEPVFSSFAVKQRDDDVHLKCKYCEKEFARHVVLGHW